MAGSAGGTLATIGILFWLTHRRLRPLFWLLFLLVVILAGATALGGLFLGTLNVVSMGFASILLGLAEDFGIVIYQESRSHPELNASELRHEVMPGIFWSAVTTAGAFLILNLSKVDRLVLAHLNGARDRNALIAVLKAAIAKGILPDSAKDQQAAYEAGLNGSLEKVIEQSLSKLAADGFLLA